MAGMIQVPYGNTMVSRIEPAMPPQNYKTYAMSMPLKTHWVAATCDEIRCEAYHKGWVSTFDLSTDLGLKQYEYCKDDRTRSFSMQRPGLSLVKFIYPPGNRCFRSGDHKRPLERPCILTVRAGDWRQFVGSPTIHKRPEDWIDDFVSHQDGLANAIQRG